MKTFKTFISENMKAPKKPGARVMRIARRIRRNPKVKLLSKETKEFVTKKLKVTN